MAPQASKERMAGGTMKVNLSTVELALSVSELGCRGKRSPSQNRKLLNFTLSTWAGSIMHTFVPTGYPYPVHTHRLQVVVWGAVSTLLRDGAHSLFVGI